MTPRKALTAEARARRDALASRVHNRLRLLIAEKADRERRTISLRQAGRETGIDVSTLSAWVNNRVTRYDAHHLAILCGYFSDRPGGCQVGDLLEYVPPEKPARRRAG